MKKVLDYLNAHLPIVIGVVLVVVNSLIDTGYLAIPSNLVSVINAVLAALGFAVLHARKVAK